MNKNYFIIPVFLLSLLFLSGEVFAYKGYGHCKGNMGQYYDAKNVSTFKGEVVAVEKFNHGDKRNAGTGLHVTLKTGNETLIAYLGPDWFISGKMKISKGDKLEVEGSVMENNGKKVIIVRLVKKGAETVELREKDGTPLWAGKGNRRRNW